MLFPRWDHLQQDQQNPALIGSANRFGTAINYLSEAPGAGEDPSGPVDIFPEHLAQSGAVVNGKNGLRFNQFFLWEASPVDGSESEVLNHLGRQELDQSFSLASFVADPNLEISTASFGRFAANNVRVNAPGGTFHPKEAPDNPGTYYMTHTGEFFFCGGILEITAPPGANPEDIVLRERAELTSNRGSDCYRNPLPLADGELLAAHSPVLFGDSPPLNGAFRLRFVEPDGSAGAALTPGITKSLTYWNPDSQVKHNGTMWELDPVEVKVTSRPEPFHVAVTASLDAPGQQACEDAFSSAAACEPGMSDLKSYLRDNKLALIVSRNVTARDRADVQQPINLRVSGDSSDGLGVYDVTHLQILQANLVRGYTGRSNGRRTLAQLMSDDLNPAGYTNAGATEVAADGSVAAFVPAERAVTWHLIDENIPQSSDQSIVKERYWVSFAAGEVRVCASCHGVNKQDQLGRSAPENAPQALTNLLNAWIAEQ